LNKDFRVGGFGRDTVSALLACCVVVLVWLGPAVSTPAQAALITLSGPNFDLKYDDSQTGIVTFGIPALSWNTIFFVPSGFTAVSTNGTGTVSTTGSVAFELIARPQVAFLDLFVTERGDYRLNGNGSSVNVSGSISATNTMGVTDTAALSISPSTPLTIADDTLHAWLGTANLGTGSGTPLGLAPTSLSIVLSSTLTASTESNPSLAFIQQKFAGERVELQVRPSGEVIVVPVPDSIYLLGIGLACLGGVTRLHRRRATG